MNRKLFLVIAGVVFAILLSVVIACGKTNYSGTTEQGNSSVAAATSEAKDAVTTETGTPQSSKAESPTIVKIKDVLQQPKVYEGKSIVVEGKIISECGSGCWFTLNDGTGTIYIDLAPSNLVIPQKRGALAKVYGEISTKSGDTYMIGKKVEF